MSKQHKNDTEKELNNYIVLAFNSYEAHFNSINLIICFFLARKQLNVGHQNKI